tara:strand:- start:571 stop:840 length:270 start_codon:yes stop_codon:yes gene_type:complete
MARVRLLSIPHGQDKDAEGIGHGDDWPLCDLGESGNGVHHWLTTDSARCSDVADDAVLNDPAELGAFMVDRLNLRHLYSLPSVNPKDVK